MIKLGIINSSYETFGNFESQIKKIKEHGYDCIDYQRFIKTDKNPMFETMTFSEFTNCVKNDRAVLDKYGIEASQAHAPWRYPPRESTKEEQTVRLAQMCRAIEGTAILGCKYFVVHPFMPFTTNDIGKEKGTLENNILLISELCQFAKKVGVTVCIENMPMLKFSLASVRDILNFVDMIKDDNLKICLDTGHATMFSTPVASAVRMIGKEKLATLHIHDNDGSADKHQRPFDGVIDWYEFSKALGEIGFDGIFSLECGIAKVPRELLEDELALLKKRAEFLVRLTTSYLK